jgi:hypothetical protein
VPTQLGYQNYFENYIDIICKDFQRQFKLVFSPSQTETCQFIFNTLKELCFPDKIEHSFPFVFKIRDLYPQQRPQLQLDLLEEFRRQGVDLLARDSKFKLLDN